MSIEWKVVIAAGGTGGHISPALAIAEHLTQKDPDCRVQFVCGQRPVEIEVYRKAGVEPRTMDVQPLARGLLGWLANIRNLRRTLAAARQYLRGEQPRVVVGMGGYVCVPVVQAAAGLKIPTLIHEQNSVAGRANRWLSRWVRAIACAYPDAATAFPSAKTRVTGNPVRPANVGHDRKEALRHWEFQPDVPTVLLFGGSQGARRLNEVMLTALPVLDEKIAQIGSLQLLWACGDKNFNEVNRALGQSEIRSVTVRLLPFIREMGLAYAAADLAIGRAGAMTLAELTANALPAIVIPLPGATRAHQRLNAQPLAEAGAAIIIEESELGATRLADQVTGLLSDRDRLDKMRQAAGKIGRPQAVEEIAEIILELRGELA